MRAVPNPLERRKIKSTRQRIGGPWTWPSLVRGWVIYPAVLVGGGVLLWSLLMLFGGLIRGWIGAGFVLAIMMGVLISPLVALWIGVRAHKKRNSSTWRALLWHGRCAVCAHPLERGFDVDGITNCAECGAHWALDRLRWGACPGCAYTLGGVPRDAAGIVTCPECGEGWWMSDRAAGADGAVRTERAATIGAMKTDTIPISLAHSPDSDDLVMWWPLVGVSGPSEEPKGPVIDTGRFRFELAARDVEELNKLVVGENADSEGLYDVTAISAGAYPAVADRYAITRVGGSFGEGYGPRVVVREDSQIVGAGDLRGKRIAVPGVNTSAFLGLSLMLGRGMEEAFDRRFEFVEMLFSEIPGAVAGGGAGGEVDAGLLIHEAQLTFGDDGLRKVVDLGEWWDEATGLPLPLGLNVVRRDLDERYGAGTVAELGRVLAASVRHAVEVAPKESRRYLQLNKGDRTEWDDADLVDRYLAMYVSGLTMDMGERGVEALERFLGLGAQAGLCAAVEKIEIV
ncbi:MAG: 1,4-dihydroxy-6-naphthoate synthase [Phycisphaerales bacterium]|jgi:1,4-dihydroxy-6-naphthoate synthase